MMPSLRFAQHGKSVFLAALSLTSLAVFHSAAQDIRPSLAGSQAATARNQPSVDDAYYNVKLGPIRFTIATGVGFEFNDNINLSQNAPLSDVMISPSLTIAGQWQATNENTLRIALNLGYEYYLEHSQYNTKSFAVGPGSEISYDIYVGGLMKLTLSDSFVVTQDPIQQPTLSNVVTFERLINTFGATALWDFNKLVVTTAYGHTTNLSMDGSYESLNSNADSLTASAAFQITDAFNVGLDAATTYTYYELNVQNDSTALSLGPFAEMAFSKYLKLRVAGGIQEVNFASGGANSDTSSSVTSPYVNMSLAHQLNRLWTETIEAAHEVSLGLQTNYQTVDSVSYTLNVKIFKGMTTGVTAFYEHVAESGTVNAEQLDQIGCSLHVGYQLTKKLQLGAAYQFTTKDSNLPLDGYTQNQFTLSAKYQF